MLKEMLIDIGNKKKKNTGCSMHVKYTGKKSYGNDEVDTTNMSDEK